MPWSAAEGEPVSPDNELNNSLLELGTWNIQGKSFEHAITVLQDFSLDLHALALQEVGQVEHDDGQPTSIHVSELDGYVVLVAKPSGCFRHVALCLDADCLSDWCSGRVGRSHFSCTVPIPPFEKGVCLVSAHLPHQGRPLDDFLAATVLFGRVLVFFGPQAPPYCSPW